MKIPNSIVMRFLLLGLLTIFFSSALHAQNAEPIGLMLSTSGVVTAEDLDGNVRRLQRRAPVYEGDTLITANRARAQVRFNDRGLIALQPNTSFFIEEHNFEGQEDGTESAIYSLLRGGLQAITGLIGHSNRDRYQVSTPIATIGLRGTHWAATFCTTACDGNPPGLYGGVADGGIDVCNGGGCTAVETNTYFYTPDANTPATTLLAPPSVVFAAAEDGEEESEEENGVIAEADGEEGDNQPPAEAVSGVAAFVQRAAANAGVTPAEFVEILIEKGLLDDVVDAVAERNRENVEERINTALLVDPNYVENPTPSLSEGGITAISIIGVRDGSFAPAGTTTDSGETDIGLISVNGNDHVVLGISDVEDERDERGAFTVTEGILAEYREVNADFAASLGRWELIQSELFLDGAARTTTSDSHFAYSEDETDFDLIDNSFVSDFQIPLLQFSLLDATAPTDQDGNLGVLNDLTVEIDFLAQMITEFSLNIDIGDTFYEANLDGSGYLDDENEIGLIGACSGGNCGDGQSIFGMASLGFLGSEADGILGHYGLSSFEGQEPPVQGEDDSFETAYFSDIALTGTYIAQRDLIKEGAIIPDGPASFPDFSVSQAYYESVSGSNAVDDRGMTGEIFASMELDLFAQTLSSFSLEIRVGDRNYYADMTNDDDYYNYYGETKPGFSKDDIGLIPSDATLISDGYNYSQISRGPVSFEDLLDGPVSIAGSCSGGDCDVQLGGSSVVTPVFGGLLLAPSDSAGLNFLGDFALTGCIPPNCTGISLGGQFALEQTEAVDHIGWQVDPVGVAASASSVAVISGTLQHNAADPTVFHPFAGALDPSDLVEGGAFTTISIEDYSHIVNSIDAFASDCDICSFAVQDAVVIDVGEVFHPYPYLTNQANISWATWSNNDSAGRWLTDGDGIQLDSNQLVNTIYADNLTQTDLSTLEPLTGFGNYGYYYYAGGPAPVDERGVQGYVDNISAEIDFSTQELNYFYANLTFGEYDDPGYRNFYFSDSSSAMLATVMELTLSGSCSGCGSVSTDGDSLEGEASFALVGDNAEQIIGALAAWSDNTVNPEGTYSVESGFVLNQEFSGDWVVTNPVPVSDPTVVHFAPSLSSGTDPNLPTDSRADAIGFYDSNLNPLEYITLTDHPIGFGYYGDYEYIGFDTDDYDNYYNYYSNGIQDSEITIDRLFSGIELGGSGTQFFVSEARLNEFGVIDGRYPVYSNYGVFASDDFYIEPAFRVDWGQWKSGEFYDQNLGCCDIENAYGYLPYVLSEDVTEVIPSAPLNGFDSIGSFEYLGGPSITIFESGSVDGYRNIDTLTMDFDFMTGTPISFDLHVVEFSNDYLIAYDSGLGPIGSQIGSPTFSIPLAGTCTGICSSLSDTSLSGNASVTLLGAFADGALGSFGVTDATNQLSLAGAFVLQQEINGHWVNNPVTESAPDGGVVVFSAADLELLDVITFGFELDAANTAELTNVVDIDHNHPNSLASFSITSSLPDCGTCSWDLREGELLTYDNTNAPSLDYLPDAYWGRWETQGEILNDDGSPVDLTQFQHWAYSPDPSEYTDDLWQGSSVYDFDYVSGTVPTDNLGNEGFMDDFAMQVDFGNQQITQFEFDLDVGDWQYMMSMDGVTQLDSTNPAGNIILTGTADDFGGGSVPINYDASGNSAIQFIGVGDAAIGTFGVNAFDLSDVSTNIHSANGAFLVEIGTEFLP